MADRVEVVTAAAKEQFLRRRTVNIVLWRGDGQKMGDAAQQTLTPDLSAGDSLYTLPLAIIPLQTRALRRALMVKNTRFESVLELFEGTGMGSGQIQVADVRKSFPDASLRDLGILQRLADIPSYDVYSLRVLLRESGIPVDDYGHLQLSANKQRELDAYMRRFTRRLIQAIYGTDATIRDIEDVVALYRNPDIEATADNLKLMARKLHISLEQIPLFLEEYGDTYLSICYYRSCHDHIAPRVISFLDAVDELLASSKLAQDRNIVNGCTRTRAAISKMSTQVHGRLQNFDRQAEEIWGDITAQRFRTFKESVESQHTAIARMLCLLTVKLEAWARRFPNATEGSLYPRAEFITNEMQAAL